SCSKTFTGCVVRTPAFVGIARSLAFIDLQKAVGTAVGTPSAFRLMAQSVQGLTEGRIAPALRLQVTIPRIYLGELLRIQSMAFVVTENCIQCKYTDCFSVCPVDCFYEG